MRRSGILMHITSLPSKYGIGDLGPEAYKFADFLELANQSLWQVLPLNPAGRGNSPYNSCSVFAGNKFLISPDVLMEEGLLSRRDLHNAPVFPAHEVEFEKVLQYKNLLLTKACVRFLEKKADKKFTDFCSDSEFWLDDFADFSAFNSYFSKPWNEWPEEIRDRNQKAISELRGKLEEEIKREKILQYLFYRQLNKLRNYCRKKDIRIIGDIPYYTAYNSSDVWVNASIFKLNFDTDKSPEFISGVPPDYFSKTGQLWNNPVYNWDSRKTYQWWQRRMEFNFGLFDIVRIDHFRGFESFWEVPAGEKHAVNGKWASGPGKKFFDILLRKNSSNPVIAEDLGYITPEVRKLIRELNFPGMKVLQFAFGKDIAENPYIPHNFDSNSVVYTGTHDNNTTRGWYENEISKDIKKRILEYLGRTVSSSNVHWELIRLAMMSVANFAVFPFQDICGLGSEARMNTPGTDKNNWRWRALGKQINSGTAKKLKDMTVLYNRALKTDKSRSL